MPRSAALLLVLWLVLDSCAPWRQEREVPEPDAQSLGWIELTVADSEVPADPIAATLGEAARPPQCHVRVELGGRTVLSTPIEPRGSAPPYSVESTFRFAAPPGEHATTVTYAGCRVFRDQLDSRQAHLRIPVRSGEVTFLRFDGSTLEARTPPGAIE